MLTVVCKIYLKKNYVYIQYVSFKKMKKIVFNRILQCSINSHNIKNYSIYMNDSYIKCYDFDPFNYDKSNCGIIHNNEKKNIINNEKKDIWIKIKIKVIK